MKRQLRLALLVLEISFIFLMGCNKQEDHESVTITVTHLTLLKPIYLTGTFISTGLIHTSGTSLMIVNLAGDSAHCTQAMTTADGTFTMHQDCSNINLTGRWYITGGTGRYTHLQGRGTLTMMMPPDVPTGVLGIDTMTGLVWF
jgi:hypothetical protein